MKRFSLTEHIAQQIETQLLEGRWRPGERIPGERTLAAMMACARSTVRAALQRLVAKGLLDSRPASGMYVSDRLQTGPVSPWRQLIGEHSELRHEMLEFRLMLEGTTAYLAATRADEHDLRKMAGLIESLTEAHRRGDAASEAQMDARFHSALAEASHNAVMRHLHNSLTTMIAEHISLNNAGLHDLNDRASEQILRQHVAVWNAIRLRQPDDARRLMREHISFVWRKLECDIPLTVI